MNQNNVEVSCCTPRRIIIQVRPFPSPPARRKAAQEICAPRAKQRERRREREKESGTLYKECHLQPRTPIPPPTTTTNNTPPNTIASHHPRSLLFSLRYPYLRLVTCQRAGDRRSQQHGECFVIVIVNASE